MKQNYRPHKLVLICIGMLAILVFSACVPLEHGMGHEGNMDGDMDESHMNSEQMAYDGPVTEIVIRRLNEDQDVDEFAGLRDAFIDLLKEHPGANVDREFAPFVDFLTFAPPEPPVFIGMTEYENMAAFEAAGSLFVSPEAESFIATFNPEVFTVMRPLDPTGRYDLSTVATELGQALEVAIRDLSSYENFDMADYEAKRNAFLEALSQQPGWVAEMQWVSLLDPNIVVGMTVYESAEAFQAIYASEFGQSQIAQDFGGGYPVMAGYASFDARIGQSQGAAMPEAAMSTLESGASISVYAYDGMTLHAYLSAPSTGVGNGTYVIEGERELVVIDTHFAPETSADFRTYVDTIGKPINRVIVTHEHPDHINGLGSAFADVESYGSAEVVTMAAAADITVGNALSEGSEEIDGIAYEYAVFQDAEAEEQTFIMLPDYGVIALGDIFYNDFHGVMNRNFENWLALLADVQAMDGYSLYLAGHGAPGDATDIADAITYLEMAQEAYIANDDYAGFQEAVMAAYPEYGGQFFFSFMEERLYPK